MDYLIIKLYINEVDGDYHDINLKKYETLKMVKFKRIDEDIIEL